MNQEIIILEELPSVKNREKDCFYIYKNYIVFWDGKYLKCEHKRRRTECKECGGKNICQHERRINECKECGGSQVCDHERIRSRCKECKGGSICDHERRKDMCSTCSKNRKNFCQLCDSVYVKDCPYFPLCFRCHCLSHPEEKIPTRYKLKQHYIYDKIKELFSNFEYDKPISCGCSKKRPDFLFDKLTHSVIVEIDEDQHINYNSSCDEVRTMSMFEDLGNRPLVMIRFNPDEYELMQEKKNSCFDFDENNNVKINKSEFENRIEDLLKTITYHLETIPNKELTEIKLYFSE